MNCFEWQSRSSDYLDGTLPNSLKQEADQHLDFCHSCNDRYKHYRIILSSIASQPRSTLPIPVRKAPFTASIPKAERVRGLARTRWQRVPWYLRSSIEGVSVVFLIIVGIATGPRIRRVYERGLDRSLNEFSESAPEGTTSGQSTVAAPLLRGNVNVQPVADAGQADDYSAGESGESAPDESDDSDAGTEATAPGDIHVGNSEIWRFNLKTDSPHEFRPKIVQVLAGLKGSASKSNQGNIGGIEAPGGIQFDLLVNKSDVSVIKRSLEKMAPMAPENLRDTPVGETFTWYKNRSKSKIPPGFTRVVIWISQM